MFTRLLGALGCLETTWKVRLFVSEGCVFQGKEGTNVVGKVFVGRDPCFVSGSPERSLSLTDVEPRDYYFSVVNVLPPTDIT